jgi:hypothetical protein
MKMKNENLISVEQQHFQEKAKSMWNETLQRFQVCTILLRKDLHAVTLGRCDMK